MILRSARSVFSSVPTTLASNAAAVVEAEDHFGRVLHDVVVRHDVAVGGNDEAGALRHRFARALTLAFFAEAAEEALERIAGLDAGRHAAASAATAHRIRAAVGDAHAHRDDGGLHAVDDVGEGGKNDGRGPGNGHRARLRTSLGGLRPVVVLGLRLLGLRLDLRLSLRLGRNAGALMAPIASAAQAPRSELRNVLRGGVRNVDEVRSVLRSRSMDMLLSS